MTYAVAWKGEFTQSKVTTQPVGVAPFVVWFGPLLAMSMYAVLC